MKNRTLLILSFISFLAIISCRKDEKPIIEVPDPGPGLNEIFNIDKVPQISVVVSTAEWNRFLANYDINQDNEEYVLASFSINEGTEVIRFDSVGLRLRGNTSRRRPEGSEGELHQSTNPDWHHAHFTINFKKYVKSQRYHNLEKINLKWFKDDANYVREVYCYDLFERYGVWTAPHSSYSTLSIKVKEDADSAYFGVYQMIESIDEDYVKNRSNSFYTDNGNLWKCSWGANLRHVNYDQMGVEDVTLDPNTMQNFTYDLKTNKENLSQASTQLGKFITDFNSKSGVAFQTWVENKIDIPLLLKTYAVNVMVGMWDDYWANTNNYYMYFDGDGKFYFIPYDYDNTLGTSGMMDDSGRQDLLNWGNADNPLIRKIIAIPEYKALYVSYIYELAHPVNNYFFITSSIERIENWQNMIRPFVANDTEEDMMIEDYPASWGNQPGYRLNSQTNNFFDIRSANLPPKN